MFELIRTLGWSRLMAEQALPFALSFATAEVLYKFHSFALECAAFLVTWFLFDLGWRWLRPHSGR